MALIFQHMDGKVLHLNNSSQKNNGESIATTSLQPMGFTDILDTTFSLYRNHFRLYLGICAVPILLRIAFSAFTDLSTEVFFSIVVSTLCYGMLVFASAQVYLGKETTLLAAFMQVDHRFWAYMGCALLWCLVVGGTCVIGIAVLILCVAGATVSVYGLISAIICLGFSTPYFGTLWGFCAQAVLVEGKSVWKALRRSGELVKGAWRRVFTCISAIVLLYFMIELILIASSTLIFGTWGMVDEGDLVEMILDVQIVQIIRIVLELGHRSSEISPMLYAIHTAINILTLPIPAIGFTLLYFDLRIRKEGFDIEMKFAKDEMKEY